MGRFCERLDELAQRLCDWMNDTFSSGHMIAVAGDGLAGLRAAYPVLPFDRRIGEPLKLEMSMKGQKMTHDQRMSLQVKYAKGKATDARPGQWGQFLLDRRCDFWAYCYMNGTPCTLCRGRNSVNAPPAEEPIKYCPAGSTDGQAWFGCCKDPQGKLQLISFLDCCGGWCATVKCENYPMAKNWCYFPPDNAKPDDVIPDQGFFGKLGYRCTVALLNEGGCQ